MKASRCLALPCLLLAVGVQPALAADLEVRFSPAAKVYAFEVEPNRGLANTVVQSTAVVNLSSQAVTLERLHFEVMRGDEVVLTRTLYAADLAKAAARGQRLEQAGMLQAFAFHFRPETLLGAGVKLSPTTELAPNTALLFGHQVLALQGPADHVRVRAEGLRGGSAVGVGATLAVDLIGSRNEYDFPLAGRSFVAAGATLHSHHRWAVPEEFALDIVRLGEGGGSHRGQGTKNADYYAYGADILAVADGKVVAVRSDLPEPETSLRQPGESAEAYFGRVQQQQMELMMKGLDAIVGNVVVIEHTNGEHSTYAHLQPGSPKVKVGDPVKRGQVIARLGNSGNSTEPHLHFQITDGADSMFSNGIPPRFRNATLPYADFPRQLQTGDIVEATP